MKKIYIALILLGIFALGFTSAITFNNIKMSKFTTLNYPSTAMEVSRVGDDLELMRARPYGIIIMEDINIYNLVGENIIGILPKGTVIPTKMIEG